MRKLLFTLIVIITFSVVNAQSPQLKELWKLYSKKKYDLVIKKGSEILESDPKNVEYNFIVGRAYYKKKLYKESMPFFLQASTHNDPHSSIMAGSNFYLGICYFAQGDLGKSKAAFVKGRKIDTYTRINDANEFWYEWLGFDELYSDWQLLETPHFRFYFQDTTDINHQRFINDCENAFEEINKFFDSEIPKQIDYFVWASKIDAKNVLKRNLSFADSRLCYIHGGNNESEGHEIAHIISLHSTVVSNKQRFISEGTAVYFDQTNLNREEYFKELMSRMKKKKVLVKDVWLKWNDYPAEFAYNLAGLFVGEIIEKYGQEKFLEFFSNQSYKNAKQVFGKDFDDFIKEFEAKFI